MRIYVVTNGDLITPILGVIFALLFLSPIIYLAIKENKLKDQFVKELSSDQILDLKNNEVKMDLNKANVWSQKAIIVNVTEKGRKVALKLLWYNTVMEQHNTFNDFQYANIKMKKSEFEAKGLRKHTVVTMLIDPEKCDAIIS